VGLGFAALENIFFIMMYGAENILSVLIRCFATAGIHVVCAMILGYGLAAFYRRGWLALPGVFSLLCAASTFHAFYNLFTAEGGAWRVDGFVMPLTAGLAICLYQLIHNRKFI
jgi:RsiW-degrading membrane proteinase PrsW (M82 family)